MFSQNVLPKVEQDPIKYSLDDEDLPLRETAPTAELPKVKTAKEVLGRAWADDIGKQENSFVKKVADQ